jgi:membrane protein
VQGRVNPGRRLLEASRWAGRLAVEVYSSWVRHRCSQLGAAIAFYGIFSLLPLLLVITSILGYLLAGWGGAPDFKLGLERVISEGLSPQVARIALEALHATQEARGSIGLIGIGTLLLAAAGAFGMLESAVQVVWDVHLEEGPVPFRRQAFRFLRGRLVSFILVGGVSLLVFISLVLDILMNAFREQLINGPRTDWQLTQLALGFFASGLIVTLLHRWLPLRRVPWRAALAGGWLTAILWEVAKRGLSAYLRHNEYERAYPLIGSALAVLLWVYVGGHVFLLGAEVAAGITRLLARSRGDLVLPARKKPAGRT